MEFVPDILKSKKRFTFTNKENEDVTLYECYTISEKPINGNYIIKHFYALPDKVCDIDIDSIVHIYWSKQYNKWYLS